MGEIKTISWQEFQTRKNRARKEILVRAAARVESGYPSHYNLDLDLLPILNTWDNIPFSFPVHSCSGTPKEHGRKEYRHVNGLQENPNAYFDAHSYMAHPGFGSFKELLESYLSGKADFHKSGLHDLEGYEGIYVNTININVPEEIVKRGDLEYLDRFWKEFNLVLERYVMENKSTRAWHWEGA